MQKMSFSPYSESEWSISPPSLDKFVADFRRFKQQDNAYVELKSTWQFKRDFPMGMELTTSHNSVKMRIDEFQPIINLLTGRTPQNKTFNQTSSTILVENIFPKMLKLGSTNIVHQLDVLPSTNVSSQASAEITLNKVNGGNSLYWTFKIAKKD
jgi:hypothetical protein